MCATVVSSFGGSSSSSAAELVHRLLPIRTVLNICNRAHALPMYPLATLVRWPGQHVLDPAKEPAPAPGLSLRSPRRLLGTAARQAMTTARCARVPLTLTVESSAMSTLVNRYSRPGGASSRSEERRVGKECRSR